MTIVAANGNFCPACDEAILNADESTRVSQAMLAFNKQVNTSLADPEFTIGGRKKTALIITKAEIPVARRVCIPSQKRRCMLSNVTFNAEASDAMDAEITDLFEGKV